VRINWSSERGGEHLQEVTLSPSTDDDFSCQLIALDVCRALNLLDHHRVLHNFNVTEDWTERVEIEVFQFSRLGVEFMDACRQRITAPLNDEQAVPNERNIDNDGIETVGFTATDLFLQLADGRTILEPLHRHLKLKRASEDQRFDFVLMPTSIHWPDINLNLEIADLLKTARVAAHNDYRLYHEYLSAALYG
jgi:hypothetical protein